MSQGMTQGALALDMAAMNSANEPVHCEDCGSDEVYRLVRKGYLEEKVYPLVGFYPWRCKHCGLRLMMRMRGVARELEFKPAETQERKKFRARKSALAGRSAKRRIK
jgi:DNA-directed RNA polymerase subunit RPC12/RpoP